MVKKSAAKKKSIKTAKKAIKRGMKSVKASPMPAEPLTHRLDALLHTMRCIAQHEDELCTLLHDARRTGKLSKPLLRELQAVLQDLPGEEYSDDLQAVLELTSPTSAPRQLFAP